MYTQFALLGSVCLQSAVIEQVVDQDTPSLGSIPADDIRAAQEEDPIIGEFLSHRQQGIRPPKKAFGRERTRLLHEWKNLLVDDKGILHRQTPTRYQLVLPQKFRHLVYEQLHCEMGHMGTDRVLNLSGKGSIGRGCKRTLNTSPPKCALASSKNLQM